MPIKFNKKTSPSQQPLDEVPAITDIKTEDGPPLSTDDGMDVPWEDDAEPGSAPAESGAEPESVPAEPTPEPAEEPEPPTEAVAPKPAKPKAKKTAKVEKVQPQATIEVTHQTGATETHTEAVGEPVVKDKPMANVGVSLAFTHGLPGYSNVKASVSLHMPSETDEASLEATFQFVENWVDQRIGKLRDDLTGEGE